MLLLLIIIEIPWKVYVKHLRHVKIYFRNITFFLKKIDVSQGRIIVLHKVEVNTPLEENDSQIHE